MPYLRSILVHSEVRHVNENGWELFTRYFCVIYAPRPQILIKYSDSTQSTVDIILELDHDSSRTYSVDENDLRNASVYLNECLRDMEERKPLIVTQVRQEVFEAFLKWMSTKSIDIMQMQLGILRTHLIRMRCLVLRFHLMISSLKTLSALHHMNQMVSQWQDPHLR